MSSVWWNTCRLQVQRLCDLDAEVAQKEGDNHFFIYIDRYKIPYLCVTILKI
ncbi:unnamed protein product [Brassica napus]|uniref:(rape) hypothetical protein n=1 Tax=Brassica napus TaxID=3708 RepID=A0A816I4Q7_BRANA|nr:unnamed protein product [Brassica napus]